MGLRKPSPELSARLDEAWTTTSTRMAAGHYPVRLVQVPEAKT
jgi:hypothetical protein